MLRGRNDCYRVGHKIAGKGIVILRQAQRQWLRSSHCNYIVDCNGCHDGKLYGAEVVAERRTATICDRAVIITRQTR
jgi:hypothetical protein